MALEWVWSIRDADLGHDVVRLDLVHVLETLHDLAEHGVNAVQVARVGFAQHHEELAPAGVLARMRHGKRADFMRARAARGFAFDLVAGAAGADAPIAVGKIAR